MLAGRFIEFKVIEFKIFSRLDLILKHFAQFWNSFLDSEKFFSILIFFFLDFIIFFLTLKYFSGFQFFFFDSESFFSIMKVFSRFWKFFSRWRLSATMERNTKQQISRRWRVNKRILWNILRWIKRLFHKFNEISLTKKMHEALLSVKQLSN